MKEGIFLSPEHRQRFVQAITSIGKVDRQGFDPEYSAALFLLTAHIGTWNRAKDYVSRSSIRFEKLLEEVDFSGGYSVMIQAASSLFNSNVSIALPELLRLDDENFGLVLIAIQIRRYGLRNEAQ